MYEYDMLLTSSRIGLLPVLVQVWDFYEYSQGAQNFVWGDCCVYLLDHRAVITAVFDRSVQDSIIRQQVID
jgi:hypothetical protein